MKNRERSLTGRVFTRLVKTPGILDMSQFSAITPHGTTYCLLGLILVEAGFTLEYDAQGRATGLAKGQRVAAPYWINYEIGQLVDVTAHDVLMPAKGREVWAGEHGDYAAKLLPIYAEDWEDGMTYDRITVEMVLNYLNDVMHGLLHVQPMPITKASRRVGIQPLRAVA